MEEKDIHLWDWARMIEGQLPHTFLIEVVLRILFSYIVLITALRLMDSRMASDISKVQMISRIVLAGAIGLPLQAPERGLLGSVIIALIAVLLERIISWYTSRYPKFESFTQGKMDILISDSVMDLPTLRRTRLTRERLFAQLRSEGIEHLGEIQRLYFESNGAFTLLKREQPGVGLSVIPDWDKDMRDEQKKTDTQVCLECGKSKEEKDEKCTNCGGATWQTAVSSIGKQEK